MLHENLPNTHKNNTINIQPNFRNSKSIKHGSYLIIVVYDGNKHDFVD